MATCDFEQLRQPAQPHGTADCTWLSIRLGGARAILLLVLTSLLLITLDLRGNALLDAARDGFDRAMRPFEDAAEVVARPVRNAWRGITDYDDLEAENGRLQAQVDAMRTNDIAARSVIEQWQGLLAIEDLESPGDYPTRRSPR